MSDSYDRFKAAFEAARTRVMHGYAPPTDPAFAAAYEAETGKPYEEGRMNRSERRAWLKKNLERAERRLVKNAKEQR